MELFLGFESVSVAEANEHAANLMEHLMLVAPGCQADQHRTARNAQDFGATLVLVLGAPAVVAVAKGISDWLRMREMAGSKVVIRDKDGNIVVELNNIRSADVRALLESKLGDAVGR